MAEAQVEKIRAVCAVAATFLISPENFGLSFQRRSGGSIQNKQITGRPAMLTRPWSARLGLLVGRGGVMKYLLISVTQRTAKSAVRKAIGARRTTLSGKFS